MAKQIITADQLVGFYGNKLGTTKTVETEVVEQPQKKRSFIGDIANKVGSIFKERVGKAQEAQQKSISGEQSLSSGVLQTIGQGAGAVGDVAFEAVKTFTPQPIQNIAKKGVEKVASTKPVQDIVTSYEAWKQKNPESAANLEATVNIASLLPIGGAPKAISKTGDVVTPIAGEALQKTGSIISKGTDEAIMATRKAEIGNILKPIETKKTAQEAVSRTTEKGVLGTKVTEPTIRESEMIDIVSEVPEISAKKTNQANYNALSSYNKEVATQLRKDIEANNFITPRKETLFRLNSVVKTLEESPVIVGDAQKTAMRLIEGAKKFVNESDGTGKGLLDARQKYDQWVLSQKPKAFDANTENAFTLANREVRKTLNELLDEKATNVDVKGSLKRQSRLFDALDVLEEKAAVEGKNKITRLFNRVGNAIGTKNQLYQTLASLGLLGGAGFALSTALPTTLLGGTGYLLYKGGKYIVSPKVRKAIGQIIEEAGNKLNPNDLKTLEKLSGKK